MEASASCEARTAPSPDPTDNRQDELLLWDGTRTEFRTFRDTRDPDCAACGKLR